MIKEKKKIIFITGTRADYGKMKSLMLTLEKKDMFEVYVFVCGMHLLKTFGSTYEEVIKDGYKNIHVAYGLMQSTDTSINLGNTIAYLTGYIDNIMPDMIVVHGDRMDALAGAIVGAFRNILVGHIEGGEISGTIDESIRHAISKFAHAHFVCNEEARERLIQLGEEKSRIYVIGSPDIDIMVSKNLPSLDDAKKRYDIPFDEYGILMYHPVTTEYDTIGLRIKQVVDGILDSNTNYVVIYPNNDLGSEVILNEYGRLSNSGRFRIFPSVRFEHFLVLLKNAKFIIGNSSAGIREASIYGTPAIDVGTRQSGRYNMSCGDGGIIHVNDDSREITEAIVNVKESVKKENHFGNGDSTGKFLEVISHQDFWNTRIQKQFVDL